MINSPIFEEHLLWVRWCAKKVFARTKRNQYICDEDDLFAAGCIGLLDAIAKWDDSKENKFKTYAEFRVRGAMFDALRELDPRGRRASDRAKAYYAAHTELCSRLGRPPATQELAEFLDVNTEDIWAIEIELESVRDIGFDNFSQANKSGKFGLQHQNEAMVQTAEDGDQVDESSRGEDLRALTAAMAKLRAQDRELLKSYFWQDLKMKQIGKIARITESRVSQKLASALAQLRWHLAGTSFNIIEAAEPAPGLPMKPTLPKKPKQKEKIPKLPIGNQKELG